MLRSADSSRARYALDCFPHEGRDMQTIFVMVKCELGRAYEVADEAVSVEQVSEVYSTSGQYDLLMKCYLDDKTDIGHFVTSRIQTLAGIQDTFTLITFKAFS
jgi:DNA-binding Lrp family transcriptional regulator